MKLLTLNCHSWQEKNQIDKIKYLAKAIVDNKYDIVSLQEVSQRIDAKLVKDNIKEDNFLYLLAKEIQVLGAVDYKYIWDCSHIGYDIYEEGLGILTNKNIIDTSSFYVSKVTDKQLYKSRKIVKATIDNSGEIYNIYSCHMGWWNDEEELFIYQTEKLLENIDENTTSFIMGDFNNNAFVRGEGYDYLLNNGLIDTYDLAKNKDLGITVSGEIAGWENNNELKRLDLILTNKYTNVISSKVIFNDENYNIISDHFGVEVVI